jgi:hypothetical protein
MNALPSPKSNRWKRFVLRFAVLVAAACVLGAAYWFTRPPELVWWRSPDIAETSKHVRVLIPSGWEANWPLIPKSDGARDYSVLYQICPVDRRPSVLRSILGEQTESGKNAAMVIDISLERIQKLNSSNRMVGLRRVSEPGQPLIAIRAVGYHRPNITAEVSYIRSNLPAFNRTYRQICNSLTIE